MGLSLKTINDELERRGAQAALTRGDGCFYFWGGEATDWLDRGRLRQFPHRRPVGVFELDGEAEKFTSVLAIPGKAVDFHLCHGRPGNTGHYDYGS